MPVVAQKLYLLFAACPVTAKFSVIGPNIQLLYWMAWKVIYKPESVII